MLWSGTAPCNNPVVENYAHSFSAWALAKHGVKAVYTAGLAGAVGAALLRDVPICGGKKRGFKVEARRYRA